MCVNTNPQDIRKSTVGVFKFFFNGLSLGRALSNCKACDDALLPNPPLVRGTGTISFKLYLHMKRPS